MTAPTQHQALADRYGQQPIPPMQWNAQIAALVSHRTARAYLPTPLPEGALEAMVAAAQSASASSNHHQWSVVAVTDPDMKRQLSVLAQGVAGHGNPHIDEAPVLLLWVADLSRNHQIAEVSGASTEVHEHLDAFVMATIDATLASQNAVVAAESMGLGICYLGAMRNESQKVADLIGLPRWSYVTFGMTVGYPDPARQSLPTPRPQQGVVLHSDRYDSETSMRALETYHAAFDQLRADLAAKAGLQLKPWAEGVIGSGHMDYMDGRQNLRGTVQARGFALK